MKTLLFLIATTCYSINSFSQIDSTKMYLYDKYKRISKTERLTGAILISAGSLSVAVGFLGSVGETFITTIALGDPNQIDYSAYKTMAIAGLVGVVTGIILLVDANSNDKKAYRVKYNFTFEKLNSINNLASAIPALQLRITF
jgi:hypothetical protein